MAMTDPGDLRRGYLDETDVAASWLEQLQRWFHDAVSDPAVVEANAIQLATADADAHPTVRTVLAKGIDARGIVFYTNYESAKARDLEANPHASAVFAWLPHERQVRITGTVGRVERAETEAYFATRPRESQIGAWASPQSQVVASRAVLDDAVSTTEQRFTGAEIAAPPNWGGYLIAPGSVEFWQGRRGRLHDRIRFRLDGTDWVRERLAP